MLVLYGSQMKRDARVRVRFPGRFNPNLEGNREPDTFAEGVVGSVIPGVPYSYIVYTDDGRRVCIADGNVEVI